MIPPFAFSRDESNGAPESHPSSVFDSPRAMMNGVTPEMESRYYEQLVGNVTTLTREFFNRLADPRRDLDKECGFPRQMDAEQYWNLYNRNSFASRVVETIPLAVWKENPEVYEDEDADEETEFEAAWRQMNADLRGERSFFQDEEGSPFWDCLKRADILSGVGQYGVILLGFDDGLDLRDPVDGVEELNSMPKPYAKRKKSGDEEDDAPKLNPREKAEKRASKRKAITENRRYKLVWNNRGGMVVNCGGPGSGKPGPCPDPALKLSEKSSNDEPPLDSPLFGSKDPYAYHISPKTIPLQSFSKGLKPSTDGYDGAGVYMATTPEEGEYHVKLKDARVFRISKRKLVQQYGVYPSTKNGLEFDDTTNEILLAGDRTIPASLLEYQDQSGKWRSVLEPAKGAGGSKKSVEPSKIFKEEVMKAIARIDRSKPGWMAKEIALRKQLTANASYGPPPNTYTGVSGDEYALREDEDKADKEPEEDALPFDEDQRGTGDDESADPSLQEEETMWEPKVRLLYMRAFPEVMAQVATYETNPTSLRYGQPTSYTISFHDPREVGSSGAQPPSHTRVVHWTRVIHVNLEGLSSETYGVERMRQVYRNLLSIEKLVYASPEMFYKGAFPGLSFESHPQLGGQVQYDKAAMKRMMEDYQNGLQRYLLTSGGAAKMLAPAVADPTPHVNVQVEAICVRIGIPVPVFKGYEIGEQASQNNTKDWDDKVKGWRETNRTPRLIVPIVDRLINIGVLPEPTGYSVQWPEVSQQSATERAQVISTLTQAMVSYVSGNVAQFMPPMEYLTRIWEMTTEEAESIVEAAEKVLEEQRAEQEAQLTEFGAPQFGPDGQPVPQPEVGPDGAPVEDDPFAPAEESPVPDEEDVQNAFCPTGKGGGVDPSCSPGKPKIKTTLLQLYRGGSVPKKGPVFLTTSKEGAVEYGKVERYSVAISNPLELENSGTSKILVEIAEKAGINDFIKYEEGDVSSETLESLSPSGQDNHLPDLLYDPRVVKALREAGYDGLHFKDELYDSHIDTWVALDASQVKPLKTKKRN